MAKSNIEIFMNFVAINPPSIAILGGVLIILVGGLTDNSQLSSNGMLVIFLGVILQVLWILSIQSKRR